MDPSTIACTLYNMLALGQCTLDEARLRASRMSILHGLDELEQAAEDLLSLGRIERVGDGVYRVRGPEGMVVYKRDREDSWNGWELRQLTPQEVRRVVEPETPIMLDELIGGGHVV